MHALLASSRQQRPQSRELRVQDEGDKSRGFGFVNFEDATAARLAVDTLNGQEVDGSKLWAGRAQKKSERESELKNRCAALAPGCVCRLQRPPESGGGLSACW